MSRFYTPTELDLHQVIHLPEPVFHHWVRVLRAQVGDTATLFNGQGGEFLAQLTQIDKKAASAKLVEFNPIDRALDFQVQIGLVMSKGDRMDYAIQKATELGVHQIQLLTSERCEMRLKYDRDQKKIDHWQAIAIAACEQCGLNRIPQILPPQPLETWCSHNTDPLRLVLALQANTQPLVQPLPSQISLLIGAEGGLSAAEIAYSEQYGFKRWQLGERVLRTETAPVVALSILADRHQNQSL
ncbi:MAG: 16S rRNA (uracil(1498)-N(3))-methyltransferase [Pseudomonadota bacterium]|nr:16S rRNA (uracil(1498)-N(3))-methyltransferase [Pseudomonadota bacterium]